MPLNAAPCSQEPHLELGMTNGHQENCVTDVMETKAMFQKVEKEGKRGQCTRHDFFSWARGIVVPA